MQTTMFLSSEKNARRRGRRCVIVSCKPLPIYEEVLSENSIISDISSVRIDDTAYHGSVSSNADDTMFISELTRSGDNDDLFLTHTLTDGEAGTTFLTKTLTEDGKEGREVLETTNALEATYVVTEKDKELAEESKDVKEILFGRSTEMYVATLIGGKEKGPPLTEHEKEELESKFRKIAESYGIQLCNFKIQTL
uniref:Kinesin motor domain-containing protein n=1 Tax=Strongyloides venezuelensis TaxID=75913 RepID=A0A0K0FDA1_STRVS